MQYISSIHKLVKKRSFGCVQDPKKILGLYGTRYSVLHNNPRISGYLNMELEARNDSPPLEPILHYSLHHFSNEEI